MPTELAICPILVRGLSACPTAGVAALDTAETGRYIASWLVLDCRLSCRNCWITSSGVAELPEKRLSEIAPEEMAPLPSFSTWPVVLVARVPQAKMIATNAPSTLMVTVFLSFAALRLSLLDSWPVRESESEGDPAKSRIA